MQEWKGFGAPVLSAASVRIELRITSAQPVWVQIPPPAPTNIDHGGSGRPVPLFEEQEGSPAGGAPGAYRPQPAQAYLCSGAADRGPWLPGPREFAYNAGGLRPGVT